MNRAETGGGLGSHLRIHLKKGRDGPPTLACIRADGTRTWGKLHPFFPVHDLTHCAVESILGFDHAFFGLVASGWNIDDFAAPGAAARLPIQALLAEHIVGLLDQERARGQVYSTTEFNQALVGARQGRGPVEIPPLDDTGLARIRALRDDLQARWLAVPLGGTLEVTFPAAATPQG